MDAPDQGQSAAGASIRRSLLIACARKQSVSAPVPTANSVPIDRLLGNLCGKTSRVAPLPPVGKPLTPSGKFPGNVKIAVGLSRKGFLRPEKCRELDTFAELSSRQPIEKRGQVPFVRSTLRAYRQKGPDPFSQRTECLTWPGRPGILWGPFLP